MSGKWVMSFGCICCFYAICDFCRTFFGYRICFNWSCSLLVAAAGIAFIYAADSVKKEKNANRSKKGKH